MAVFSILFKMLTTWIKSKANFYRQDYEHLLPYPSNYVLDSRKEQLEAPG